MLEALDRGVIYGSVDDFYTLSRLTLVKDEAYFDRFDLAFANYFKGVAALPDEIAVADFDLLYFRRGCFIVPSSRG